MGVRLLFAILVLTVLLPVSLEAADESLYCERQIVRKGDPIWRVSRKCPEPFWRESYERAGARDRHGHPVHFQRFEIWTLNFGQRRLMRRLVFVDGRLSRIDALGYGVDYPPGSRNCSPGDLARAGKTVAEIYARCGEPDYSYELSGRDRFGYYGGPSDRGRRELWTYDFGSHRHPRELLFVDGRLQGISTERR